MCSLPRCVLIALLIIIILTAPAMAMDSDFPKSSDTRNVTDCAGRVVSIPAKVQRIACLYSFAGHAVALLGRGRDIVAVAKGLKRDSLLLEICPGINDALVPKSQGGINIEELLNAKPDIVFLSADVGKDSGETDKLDTVGIPYLIVDYSSLEQQQQAVSMIGSAVNRSEEADAYVRYYKRCIQKVRDAVSSLTENEVLKVYHSVNEPTRTAIPLSLTTGWLDVLGINNVANTKKPGASDGKQNVSLEQILFWNPDVILTNEPAARKEILSDRSWSPLKAVREGRVYLLPVALSRWGHPGSIETPLAILWAARTLYPDRFKTLDMTEATRYFYRQFFEYELSDTMIKQILDGKLQRKPKQRDGRNL
jgi:iron complex transport system substrate-binding protein